MIAELVVWHSTRNFGSGGGGYILLLFFEYYIFKINGFLFYFLKAVTGTGGEVEVKILVV